MAEITKTVPTQVISSTAKIALAALAVAAYFVGLTLPLMGPDEPRYAQVAREMFDRGDWVTPTLGGSLWFEKPVLLYWLEKIAYHIFGVNEFSARLGPALFGIGIIVCLYLLGRSIRRGSLFAAIAASTVGIIAFAHGASFDIILTLPITASLAAYYLHQTSERPRLWLLAAYFFLGVGLLAKGLVGAIFPVGIIFFYHAVLWKRPTRFAFESILWGGFATLATAGVWYLPMYLRHGYYFIDQFFIQHHFQRFTSNKYQHPGSFLFFFWMLPVLALPWAPLAIAELWKLFRGLLVHQKESENTHKDLAVFAAVWLFLPLVFFSFSGSKLPGYILPAVPAAVILASLFVVRSETSAWVRKLVPSVAALTLIASVLLILFYLPGFAAADSIKAAIADANAGGYGNAKVLGLHTTSHNAEFYAAGRLVRMPDGKQRRFLGAAEVKEFIVVYNAGKPVLVIVPHEYLEQLQAFDELDTKIINNASDDVLAAVSAKP
ncbi:MAG: glycosyltransferase family 39 protein [Acidobacteria bacterium]|nr:glycosyltransferase family 39 protein [Acidobacteriota bacterium]